MSGVGMRIVLIIGITCFFGILSYREARAISLLSDTLKNVPKIFRIPSTEPPNNAVHRDFGVPPRHPDGATRDIGPGPEGEPAVVPAAAAPWAVAVSDGPQLNRDFLCAGALVAKDWVLTAAHCTYNLARRWPNDHSAYVFENAGALFSPGSRFPVREIVPHPDYDPRTLQNDLALVRIVTSGKATNAPIPLDGMPISQQVGEIASIFGWGVSTEQSRQAHAERLHVIQAAVLDDQVCFSASNFPELSQRHVFCGRPLSDYHDVCFRFGGSPIVFYDRNANLYLGGLVSWPAACGDGSREVNVYLDVQSYVPWIKSVIGKGAG